jgi:indolepyruvate ferredoxin oxidoreductase beta subunit
MKCDIVVAGVGGQGVVSISSLIAWGALKQGLHVKQSEVHGMAQRGGAVQANLRLSDAPVASDLVPLGRADLILSMEPMESLRYLHYLAEGGALITASEPMRNIPDYPELEALHRAIRAIPGAILLDAEKMARKAGSARASNMVIVGAAVRRLPIPAAVIEGLIRETFARKGEKVVETNLKAFAAGQEAGR